MARVCAVALLALAALALRQCEGTLQREAEHLAAASTPRAKKLLLLDTLLSKRGDSGRANAGSKEGGHHHKHSASGQLEQQGASVTLQEDGQLVVGPLGAAGAVAEATFVDGANTPSNMGHLEVWTWPVAADEQQMRAAGFVEAWLTAERMAQHFANMWGYYNLSFQPQALAWLDQQHGWLRQQVSARRPSARGSSDPAGAAAGEQEDSAFWAAQRLLLAQLDGMLEGYTARRQALLDEGGADALPELTQQQLYALCSLGDLGDIAAALQRQQQQQQEHQGEAPTQQQRGSAGAGRRPGLGRSPMERRAWDEMGADDLHVELATSDRCSALVKVSPDFTDLWVAQAAWFTYSAMLRVFKHYDFALAHPGVLSRSLAFSSYYGQLSSDDDFYLAGDTNLVVLQTTNRIFDERLLDLIQPPSALSWQRVRAALAVAPDGPAWAQAVRTHNSGTYTNSWLVLAAGLFERGKPLAPWLLTVVEQAPGAVWHQDVTRSLESGYMALFNVPVTAEAYNVLGYPAFVQRMSNKGAAYEQAVSGALWQVAPRAKIFRRDHGGVRDLEGMMRLMRSNDWQTDPFSLNSSLNAVCGRGDVHPTAPRLSGCYDGKVSSLEMALSLEAQVINGPPYSARMPAFAWEGPWLDQPLLHHGQPTRFAFEWERVAPHSTREARRRYAAGGAGAAQAAAAAAL